ncbi:MAG TPA: hypothetical protein PK323_14450 [Bacteroidia bacterium]|nr:hypothetical protein [Bacteroidia bacterium]
MKRALFICYLLFFINSILFAQEKDSLVYFSDLTFRNKTEKTIFQNLNKGSKNIDLLRLFLLIKPTEDSASIEPSIKLFDELITQIKSAILDGNNELKITQIKAIVSKAYLKSSKFNCTFQETLEQGFYDCYTAAALYGLVFSKLNIPFQIIENKSGVILQAFPSSDKIEIKMNTSDARCFGYSEHFRDKWSKSMFYSKLIPYNEFEKGYSDTLFEKYYFNLSSYTLIDLAGVMLCNLSLKASDERKVQEAVYFIQKSYFIQPNSRNAATLKYHLVNALGKYNYENKLDFNKLLYLCSYINMKDVEITGELITSEYTRFLNTQIEAKFPLKEVTDDYLLIYHKVTDKATKLNLEFIFNFEILKAILYRNIYQVDKTNYMQKAYKIKPEEQTLKSIIFEALNKELNEIKDAEKALKLVDSYSAKFEFIEKSISSKNIKISCYLELAYKNFSNELIVEGDAYLKKSEALCSQYKITPVQEVVERGYLSAAKYNFNKGNKVKAKEYLLKGMEYAPDSKLIQDKLKLVQ